AEAADRHGFKYVWSVEHHFLEEYSHLSASEIVLPFIAARTRRIHVGSAIWNLTPPVNHPARVAERVAMLDHLSEGRFEFGTGRGSSSTEFKGFGIPDGDTTRAMFDEALREILRMWRETPYGYEGRFFSMPPRNVLPKPWTRPHPPLWMACGSPSTFAKAARLGVGALCFSLGTPRDFEPLIRTYKDTIRHADPGRQPAGGRSRRGGGRRPDVRRRRLRPADLRAARLAPAAGGGPAYDRALRARGDPALRPGSPPLDDAHARGGARMSALLQDRVAIVSGIGPGLGRAVALT